MKLHKFITGGLFAAAMLGFAPTASAQALQTDGFTAACSVNPDFLQGAGGDAEGLGRVCGCMTDAFVTAQISQTDIDLLAADLDGSATDDDRMAYETYEDLSAFAGQTLSDCLVIEGFADGADPGAGQGDAGGEVDTGSNMAMVDAGPFQASCEITDWSDYPEVADDEDQVNLCQCIAGGLVEKGLIQHDFESLTAYYDGEISTDDVEQTNPGAMAVHDDTMNQCLGQL